MEITGDLWAACFGCRSFDVMDMIPSLQGLPDKLCGIRESERERERDRERKSEREREREREREKGRRGRKGRNK